MRGGDRQTPPIVNTGLLVRKGLSPDASETSPSSILSLGLSCSYQTPSPLPGLGLTPLPDPQTDSSECQQQDRWLLAPPPAPNPRPKLLLQVTYHRAQSKEKVRGRWTKGTLRARNHSEGVQLRWASQKPAGMGGPQEMNDRQGT